MNADLSLRPFDKAFACFLISRANTSVTSNQTQKKQLEMLCAYLSQQSQKHHSIAINTAEKILLGDSGLATGKYSPLVIADNRLYLQKYWVCKNTSSAPKITSC